jgi:hypothetical protein
MGARGLLALVACALALLPAAADASSGAPAACRPGVQTIAGVKVRVLCGTARGTVRFRGQTFTYRRGECAVDPPGAMLAVRIGVEALSGPPGRFRYFGLVVVRPTRTVFVWSAGGKAYLPAPVRVRLAPDRRSGSFSGKGVVSVTSARGAALRVYTNASVSGSFRC